MDLKKALEECFRDTRLNRKTARNSFKNFEKMIVCITNELKRYPRECPGAMADRLKPVIWTIYYIWRQYIDFKSNRMHPVAFDKEKVVVKWI